MTAILYCMHYNVSVGKSILFKSRHASELNMRISRLIERYKRIYSERYYVKIYFKDN
jgi:hypothetical protein